MKTALAAAALILAMASVGGAAAVVEEPADADRPKVQRRNPLNDPNFVPIMVNIQNLTNARIYREAGINVYAGIDDVTTEPKEAWQFKPTAETLKVLSDLGMYAIVDQGVWGHLKDNPTIVGWECPVDEPDNVQEGGKAMPLEKFLDVSRKLKALDPSRPYIVCFGQGVINDLFKGRGIERSEYPKYMDPVDFIMYDVYPITNSRREDGENYLELTGQGVSRIRQWTANKKPVMCWIETTHIKHPTKAPTPAQTGCEVWITMVHGARGVGYFCHDFTLESKRASALSRDKAMLDQLRKTNGKLVKLAPIISAPLATEPATVKSEGGGRVIASTKKLPGATVVLSVNVLGEKARAVIPLAGLTRGARIEVLEEGRTLTAAEDGAFADEFAPYQEHVYKLGM